MNAITCCVASLGLGLSFVGDGCDNRPQHSGGSTAIATPTSDYRQRPSAVADDMNARIRTAEEAVEQARIDAGKRVAAAEERAKAAEAKSAAADARAVAAEAEQARVRAEAVRTIEAVRAEAGALVSKADARAGEARDETRRTRERLELTSLYLTIALGTIGIAAAVCAGRGFYALYRRRSGSPAQAPPIPTSLFD